MANISKADMLNKVDNASDQFAGVITKTEKAIFDSAVALIKKLDIDSQGHIRITTANLKLLSDIKSRLGKLTKSKEYLKGVKELVKAFDDIYHAQVSYYSTQFAKKTLSDNAKKKFAAMQRIAVTNTIEGLTGSGVNANVTEELSKILLRAVTTGAKYSDLVDEFRSKLISSGDNISALAKYANTYATTALTQYAGQNNKLFTDDLGTEWFEYVGSQIETTRELCNTLLEHHPYIHQSEIKDILAGRITDQKTGEIIEIGMNPKTGLPKGMIEGTTPDNFQVNVGGWNCRHQLVPIAKEAVPKEIRERYEEKPKKEEENAYEGYNTFVKEYHVRLATLRNAARIAGMESEVENIISNKERTYIEYVDMYGATLQKVMIKLDVYKTTYNGRTNSLNDIAAKALNENMFSLYDKISNVMVQFDWNSVRSFEQYQREINAMDSNIAAFKNEYETQKLSANGQLGSTISECQKYSIDYIEAKVLDVIEEQEIISRLGGGDRTSGSCSSLAFAYAGNKGGYNVLDFRGGRSMEFFSKTRNICNIAKAVGGKVEVGLNGFQIAQELLKSVEIGKEYYFTSGSHAAIIRRTQSGLEYLELQSPLDNGFKPLTNAELKYRFNTKRSRTLHGMKLEMKECLIDIDLLKNNPDFIKMLGYINTATDKQIKGSSGNIK